MVGGYLRMCSPKLFKISLPAVDMSAPESGRISGWIHSGMGRGRGWLVQPH